MSDGGKPKIAVVIPCYRVGELVLGVIARIGPEVNWIYVVDDLCPLKTGALVQTQCQDPRVKVLFHEQNQGVGGAVMTGYRAALCGPATIVVKLDGDGQMAPELIGRLTAAIRSGRADYTKGNRFHQLSHVMSMPAIRLAGNAVLSFMTKLSSGYWQLFDPTNGMTAIHRLALQELDMDRIAKRYFFESDMLHHLNQARAVVTEMPMLAQYEDEPSSLQPGKMIVPFLLRHARNTFRRLLYHYFIRGFSVASLELLLGIPLIVASLTFGAYAWIAAGARHNTATAGTVMLAALPLIVGSQLLLSWINYDVSLEPKQPLQKLLDESLD